eukprot:COSAG02_NODE_478_length_21511_cov_120.811087_22_plen_85_part_00
MYSSRERNELLNTELQQLVVSCFQMNVCGRKFLSRVLFCIYDLSVESEGGLDRLDFVGRRENSGRTAVHPADHLESLLFAAHSS